MMNDSSPNDDVTWDLPSQDHAAPAEHPQRIGRYRIEKVLGMGSFGIVFLAQDEQLNRPVAVKVPHAALISKPEDAAMYLAEARTVANLDQSHIVPVFDVGSTDECPCYVVSKYIPGTDLATKLKLKRFPYREAAELVATVADALHYAHKKGIVHRDVKPGNILIGNEGQPFVVDFGLALRDENIGKGPKCAGTPAYMSPEQARGEGHRVDGRSDVFSLGVVFYELLAGRKPFRGDTRAEIMEQVAGYEAKPLRQYDDKLPKELERVCQKAMAKRASERYSSAHDMAEDLRLFLVEQTLIQSRTSPGGHTPLASNSVAATHFTAGTCVPSSTAIRTISSDTQPIKIVPKGLRSFDVHDAEFFLELLPGPRDREGLPDSLRFWKTRIEETDADNTFTVGMIYGPSGCGKSSLVKAGLLPRLCEDVISVYIEATPEETETRLLHGLRKRCPSLEGNLSLKATLAELRRGHGIPVGKKVLIVLDQFEQWLHAKKEEENSDLVQALRQCDGSRVQCIVMVRDDFWLAATRFMGGLEVELLQGQNTALADLFDLRHAQKVLAAFGQAFGTLPDNLSDATKEQQEFIKQSVVGLSEESKVICVRLALFAEMMKGKAWTPSTLKEVGGTKGIGVTFLEETFSSQTAHPMHRLHQKAARAVLKELLPSSGTNIKGYMRSHAELLEVSGYGNRPKDFDDLIRILDSDIRLITPTDPDGKFAEGDSATQTQAGQKYFQLTHDYLVRSLRDWLTRKQKETRRGRAELKLLDTSVTWNSKTENRFLPSLVEWLSIRALTDKQRWTAPQRAMIYRADRFHLSRLATGMVVLGFVAVVGFWTWHRVDQNRKALLANNAKEQEAIRIEGLVGRLVSAEPSQISQIVKELDANPDVAATFLSPLVTSAAKTSEEKRSQLHARLATVARDPSFLEPLVEELLTGKVVYVLPIRQQLRSSATQLTGQFRSLLRDEAAEPKRRFHAALALADYIPESESNSWTDEDLKFVAQQLVSENAEFQPLLRDALRPIHKKLLTDLERIFSDSKATDAQRLSAANAFADYSANDVARLSRLLTLSTAEQYAVLYPIVSASPAPSIVEDLGRVASTLPPSEMGSVGRVHYGQRRANAAITLLRLGEREQVLPVFEMTDDPEALTQFVFRCSDRGVRAEELLECLRIVSERPADRYRRNALYALILALGEYELAEIPESQRSSLLKQLADWYRDDPSSGLHGATGWLLRKWGQVEIVRATDQTPVPYAIDREWFTLAITVTPTSPLKADQKPAVEKAVKLLQKNESDLAKELMVSNQRELLADKTFYFTFVVFPRGSSLIGSVEDEPERSSQENSELRHEVNLTRPFALLDREVTFEELLAFSPNYAGIMQQFKAQPSDAEFGADWYGSVSFCRWLSRQSGLSEADQSYADPESLDKDRYPREPTREANWAPRNWPLELGRPGFRLPSDAEWEVASRAGARTSYGYGGDVKLLSRFGWFSENSEKRVHPPKQLRPSMRGLFDLHGNLFEWTHDWYADYRVDAITNPLGPLESSSRVSRGGCWLEAAELCRNACRSPLVPSFRYAYRGLRLALSLPEVSGPAEESQEAEPAVVDAEVARQ